MMVLNSIGGAADHHHHPKVMKGFHRKRKSKGTIAGYALGNSSIIAAQEATGNEISENASHASPINANKQPQHSSDNATPPSSSATSSSLSQPCYSARLTLLCTQNAIRMGARTQLNLCPPGRPRRDLQAALRQRARSQQLNNSATSGRRLMLTESSGGYYGLDKLVGSDALEDYDDQEEDYLINTNTFEVDSDEEASSGDEDELLEIDDLFSEDTPALDDDERYTNLREPLYTPVGAESALAGGAQMNAVATSAKLPFNRRKIRFFDLVSATESSIARSYLQREVARAKMRSKVQLAKRLRKLNRKEKKRKQMERGEPVNEGSDSDKDSAVEKSILEVSVSQIGVPVTPVMSAALLIESLCVNPVESLEGMGRCYDGIVAAGAALLDHHSMDPTTPPTSDEKTRPMRSEIMATLAPLLITSLEQASGDTILLLAKLRRMCGTARYQRRFVQRVAPCLIRPPRAAMWCLRHHNDMEAILAAAELMFDSAFDVFSKGWHERGRLILADTKRAETLKSAAQQLRNLSSEPTEGLVLGFAGHAHINRRRFHGAGKNKDGSGTTLAEWEVIAVDRQIRISISNVLSTDWSKPVTQPEASKPHYRRYSSAKRPAVLPQSTSADMSSNNFPASPRSPVKNSNFAHSPQHLPIAGSSHFGESAEHPAAFQVTPAERAESPPPPSILPSSPHARHRGFMDQDGRASHGLSDDPSYRTITSTTPPKSPIRSHMDFSRMIDPTPPAGQMSPKRSESYGGMQSGVGIAPSSPSSSIATNASAEMISYKPMTNTSKASAGSSTAAHYRMLTSTAAERKRTVAACRALRAQIVRFEDAFFQVNGRAPKGAAERAPLATTYAQYREWKRAIRADAACRIQALFRGARQRWILLRGNDPLATRIVMNRAGRGRVKPPDSVINSISIPAEIGQPDEQPVPLSKSSVDESGIGGQALAPKWASTVVRRRSNSGDRVAGDTFGGPPAPRPYLSSSLGSSGSGDLGNLSLPELQARKRDLKQQLKQYDMNFARKHGRMPVKSEKEPIRHLYESYNALKNQINFIEKEGSNLQPPPSPSPTPPSSVLPQRASSPPSGSDSGLSGSDEPASHSNQLLARSKRKVPKAASPPVSLTPPVASTPPVSSSQDLAALKEEKSQLHQMLRSYEREFFRENRRQVSSFADIRPVAGQYRRYKEIKKAIATLQQAGSR